MGFEITKHRQTYSLARSRIQGQLERYSNGRAIGKIQREGAKHLIAERIYALKAEYGMDLTKELDLHGFNCAAEFIEEITKKLSEGNRSPEAQKYLREMAESIADDYSRVLLGIMGIGAENIADQASQNVEPVEEKRWYQ